MLLADTLSGRIGLTILAVLLALANLTVIVTYAVNRRLRTLANRFVVALAASDLLLSIFFIPMKTWQPTHESIGALSAFFLLASLFNVCGCTYDRYIAIKNPLHYPAVMTKKRFFQVMLVVWLVPLVISLIPQIWMRNSAALDLSPAELALYERRFVAFMTLLVLVICVVLITVYIYIFNVAKKHYEAMKKSEPPAIQDGNNDPKGRKKRSQSIKSFFTSIKSTMLFATIGTNFVLCWFPLIVINLAFAFDFLDAIISLEFMNASEILTYLNSLLNPVAYAFFQREFRRTIMRPCLKARVVSLTDTTAHYRTDYDTNQN